MPPAAFRRSAAEMPHGKRVEVRRCAPGDAAGTLWVALRTAEAPVSIVDLHLRCRILPATIQYRIRLWVQTGLVVEVPGDPKRYVMSSDAPATRPKVGNKGTVKPARTINDRIWAAMRVCKYFDVPTLMLAAQAPKRSVTGFLVSLCRSGHVRMTKRGNSMTGEWSSYQLVRNSGPRAPKRSSATFDGERRAAVIDPNSGEAFDISPGAVSLLAVHPSRGVNHVR